MKLLFTCVAFLLSTHCSFSQENQLPQNYNDSLSLAKSMIDQLSPSEIMKQREKFIYLNRTQPSKINSDVLIYLDEKYKLLSK
jgi:hypothetical protein